MPAPAPAPAPPQLLTLHIPQLPESTLLLALTGWMDGGQVSTGTVKQIMAGRDAKPIARIEPDDFYIYNFPGSMEIAALFRPHVHYESGVITKFDLPTNTFLADVSSNLLLFVGKEPNLKWQTFADC